MALHWLIAAAVLGQIGLGLVMTRMAPGTMEQFDAYQLHKSIGVMILLASVMRLVWRLMNPVPPRPAVGKGRRPAALIGGSTSC